MNFKDILKSARTGLITNSPSILTGVGIVGTVTTAYLAAKAVPVAQDKERAYKEQVWDENEFNHLTKQDFMSLDLVGREKFNATWKAYIPPVAVGVLTICAIGGANHINLRRNAAIASLYSLTESTMSKYQEKVIEEIGQKKHRQIKEKVLEEQLQDVPVDKAVIQDTGRGSTIIFDSLTGQYFMGNIENVRRAMNDANDELFNHTHYVTLNEWLDYLGIERMHELPGELIGWTTDGMLDVYFESKLMSNGEPCIAIAYDKHPRLLER